MSTEAGNTDEKRIQHRGGLLTGHGLDRRAMADLVRGEWLAEPEGGSPILGASIDTRTLAPGQVFFALPGERVDGHDYLHAAAEAGGAVAVVERDRAGLPAGLPQRMGVLRVGDVRTALATLASAYRRALPGLRVVGVTGSNGKTTTVRMIHAALAAGGLRGTHALKSHNNALGVPLTLLNAMPGDDFVVCEIGTSEPGEIAALATLAAPDAAVITSVGMAHIESFGSVGGIAQEKAAIVRTLPVGAVGVVPAGLAELDTALSGPLDAELIRVGTQGTGSGTGLGIDGLRSDHDGARCAIIEPGGTRTTIRTALPGVHNAQNAALAFAVARRLGVSAVDAAAGLLRAEAPPMRLERVPLETPVGPVHAINDAYNANPDSVRATLSLLASGGLDPERAGLGKARRVAVLGEMLEMGPHAERVHTDIARRVALAEGIDGVVLIGTWAARMAEVISASRPGMVLMAETNADADWVSPAASLVRGGDIVLLKGSRGVRLERLLEALGAESARAVE